MPSFSLGSTGRLEGPAAEGNRVSEPIVDQSLFKGVDLTSTRLSREVELIRKAIGEALRVPDPERPGKQIGQATAGIYAFFDFDGEPIYVGQTAEKFSTRLGRHLTGMRSDSVAKFVLDPFEVYAVSMWSLPQVAELPKAQRRPQLDVYEYKVHTMLTEQSKFSAVLNEGSIPPQPDVDDLPDPVSVVIVPDEIFAERSHPDVRIARRAQTISLLARHISERKVSKGLRRTLLVQSERLRDLAARRSEALAGTVDALDIDIAED